MEKMKRGLMLAVGIFVGNWLVVPLVFERTFTEGLAVGALAALLVLGVYAFLPRSWT